RCRREEITPGHRAEAKDSRFVSLSLGLECQQSLSERRIMNRFGLTLRSALVMACLSVGISPALAGTGKRPPNIVYILADDLGWTDLGCQGSKYYETPNIDRLAKQGVRFTGGYTCGPNCQPTRAALMSGRYGPRTGVYAVGSIDRFDWKSRPLRPVD